MMKTVQLGALQTISALRWPKTRLVMSLPKLSLVGSHHQYDAITEMIHDINPTAVALAIIFRISG